MRLYGEIIPELYLTCTTITSVDLAHYGVSRAKDWVSVDCGTISLVCIDFCHLAISANYHGFLRWKIISLC